MLIEEVTSKLEAYLGIAVDPEQVIAGTPAPRSDCAITNRGLTSGREYDPKFAVLIADECAQVRELRDTKGNLPENIWYRCLGVVGFCEDGDKIAHEWSSGDPRYTEAETDKKLSQVRRHGPTTCATFESLNPEPCQACPHHGRIKSPIHFGFEKPKPGQAVVATPSASLAFNPDAFGTATAAPNWQVPTPLVTRLLAVPPFELQFLPVPLQQHAADMATTLHAPLDFIGTNLLGATGSLIGALVAINFKLKTYWLETANVWALIIGDISSMKTPSARPMLSFMDELEAAAAAVNSAALQLFAAQTQIYNQQIRALSRSTKQPLTVASLPTPPTEPKIKRHMINDSSYQALGAICKDNPQLLVCVDEASGLFGELDDPRNKPARAFYLSAYNGQSSYSFERIGRGQTFIPNLNISVLGNIQPVVFDRQVVTGARNGSGADGLTQRFGAMTYPDPMSPKFVDQPISLSAANDARDAFKLLAQFDPLKSGATPPLVRGIPYFKLDAAAYATFCVWNDWRMKTSWDMTLSAAYRAHVSKLTRVVAAVALLIHILEVGHGDITGPTMERATAAALYYAAHARRVYAAGFDPGYEPARRLAQRISLGSVAGSFTVRDAQRKGWAGMETLEDAITALGILEEAGWVRRVEQLATSKGGRPTTRWDINPLGGGAKWE